MKNYIELASDILLKGHIRQDRTGTGTISVFGPQLAFDLREGFPAITTKKLFLKGVFVELMWMISGETSANYMLERNVHIWDEWLMDDDELGRVYGVQWRNWMHTRWNGAEASIEWVDQLQNAIDTIRNNPTDRRMLVTAWNPGEIDQMALPPCHMLYQFYVEDDFIDVKVYQRSADVFLGLPFDIASYATLLTMVGHVTGKIPRQLIYTLGDTHIYSDHVDQILTQVRREPLQLPTLNVNARNRVIKEIDDFEYEDLQVIGYEHHPGIKGRVSK